MAEPGDLITARRLVQALDLPQSQASLASQMKDCIPIIESLGYYDLADFLRKQRDLAINPP